ncbi:MAG: acyl-CoA dehydrogenase family protein, partial [Acidimicrobiia bacterium]
MTDAEKVEALTEELVREHDAGDRVEFRGAQYDLGLAWVHFPVGFGGLGVDPALQRVVESRLRAEKIEYPETGWNGFGLYLAAPTIVKHAQEQTRARLLRPLFTGEEVWCQLFSEPGAGSDLASLATRAVRDGDEWVVNGQKVWNTLAHMADRGMLVARTDPDVPKHKGLTYFALDMHAAGVEVRPLVQITGEAEFNEVYMTDVHVPDTDRIGDTGDGWRVSMTTLMNERVTIGGAVAQRESGPIGDLMRLWRGLPEDRRRDPVARDR